MAQSPKKIAFIFGGITLTFTPADIEAIWDEWQAENPGKNVLDMPPDEFARRSMERLKANARPTRTVLHN